MKLSREESKMRDGAYGPVKAEAIDNLIQFGEAFDAPRLVDIIYAHHPAEMAIYRGEVESVVDFARRGARVCVPTTSSTLCTDLDQFILRSNATENGIERLGTPKPLAEKQCQVVAPHQMMGIVGTYTCTPYLLGYLPPKGSFIASVESSAVIYFNSMLGARTNRGGTFTGFAAVTGKYPYMGYLVDENRLGTHLVIVDLPEEKLRTYVDYNALGFYVGSIVGSEVPVFSRRGGIPLWRESPNTLCQENIIGMGAALATAGSVTMYHIPGITAEANTIEQAFGGRKPREEIYVGVKEIQSAYEQLTTTRDSEVDFVCLGCPHYNLEQIRLVAERLEGKRVSPNVRFWICTNRFTKYAAGWQGYVEIIEKAGALLVCDTCPVESHMRLSTCAEYGLPTPQIKTMVTDSAKQARYVKDLIGCNTVLADTEDCIKAALMRKARL